MAQIQRMVVLQLGVVFTTDSVTTPDGDAANEWCYYNGWVVLIKRMVVLQLGVLLQRTVSLHRMEMSQTNSAVTMDGWCCDALDRRF